MLQYFYFVFVYFLTFIEQNFPNGTKQKKKKNQLIIYLKTFNRESSI